MTSQDFLNVSYDETLAPTAVDATTQYATIQWSNSNPSGWLLPADRAEEFGVQPPAGWERRMVLLGGSEVPCYHSSVAEVAILAINKRWFVHEDNRDRYLDKYVENAGARTKTHVLCLVRGSDDLFQLSVKGTQSINVGEGLSKLGAAMKREGAVRPHYFFWTRIKAGESGRAKTGATVTPAIVELPAKTDDALAWLKARFTGAEFVAMVERDHAEAIREFVKPRTNSDVEASNGHDATTPAPLPATGPAPTTTTTTSAAPWDAFDAMPSATGDRAVALGLAQRWTHEAAVKWALDQGAFDDEAKAKADYTYLWNRTKTENGGRIAQLAEWWPVWVDAVLATMTDQVAVEEPGF